MSVVKKEDGFSEETPRPWQMGEIPPLGFLHMWYYQSLQSP